jgi:hypothetical protein
MGTEPERNAGAAGESLLHYYVINRRGTAYALYEGLLGEAHRRGLRGIRTRLLQQPTAGNGQVAVCAATVVTAGGEFTATGEASPPPGGATEARAAGDAGSGNLRRSAAASGDDPARVWRTLIQVAEARAKARALRDALNLDLTPLEELDVDEIGEILDA